jgi:tellurite methyltransferase
MPGHAMRGAMSMCHTNRELDKQMKVSDFFDGLYRSEERYWWHEDVRHVTEADAHQTSLLTQMTLRLLKGRPPGRALDIGAGEGADSIRLARLGYSVDAIEVSRVGAAKIRRFARDAEVNVNIEISDAYTYEPAGYFDVVICNGVLQYIEDKRTVVERLQGATRIGGINVISLWSTYTPVPDCHNQVPIFCDDEDGIVSKLYQHWDTEFIYMDRDKKESSHSGMPSHSHSHIKLIARRSS